MINCQMDDTDNNCLRVQTERGRRWGLPEKASQVNFRLYSWKNPGTADGSSEIVRVACSLRKKEDFTLSLDILAKRMEHLHFRHGVWTSAVNLQFEKFLFLP